MFEKFKQIALWTVRKLGVADNSAFSGVLVASIMAVMIGAILLVLTFTVVNAVIVSTPVITSGPLNASQASTMTIIGQALGIVGIGLIVVGIAGIIYVVAPLAGILQNR